MKKSLLLFIVVGMMLVGCRQEAEAPQDANVDIDLAMDPVPPAVGDAVLTVTLLQGEEPVNDATVEVRGDMTHAGMQPVIRTIEGGEEGVYETDFEWTMAGDWIITVQATLADDTVVSQEFEYTLDGDMDMSDDDMSDTDMSDAASDAESADDDMAEHNMDDMAMGELATGSSTTGGYLQLTNNGEEDDALVSVAVDFADVVQIHETRIEDDMASMVEIGSIVVPAGETASLEPGGMHMMFMGLTRDLMPGDTVTLMLTFESGNEAEIVAPVQDEAPEVGEAVTAGDISIGGAWVRPALAGDSSSDDMGDMDMSEELEPSPTAES